MKLIEYIGQQIFVRTDHGAGFNIYLKGDITFSTSGDILCVYSYDVVMLDEIDMSTMNELFMENGIYFKSFPEYNAYIFIKKQNN